MNIAMPHDGHRHLRAPVGAPAGWFPPVKPGLFFFVSMTLYSKTSRVAQLVVRYKSRRHFHARAHISRAQGRRRRSALPRWVRLAAAEHARTCLAHHHVRPTGFDNFAPHTLMFISLTTAHPRHILAPRISIALITCWVTAGLHPPAAITGACRMPQQQSTAKDGQHLSVHRAGLIVTASPLEVLPCCVSCSCSPLYVCELSALSH